MQGSVFCGPRRRFKKFEEERRDQTKDSNEGKPFVGLVINAGLR
jgi:hypothetical protein